MHGCNRDELVRTNEAYPDDFNLGIDNIYNIYKYKTARKNICILNVNPIVSLRYRQSYAFILAYNN